MYAWLEFVQEECVKVWVFGDVRFGKLIKVEFVYCNEAWDGRDTFWGVVDPAFLVGY